MSKGIFIYTVAFFFLTACNKKNDTGTTVIQYQVIATNSSKIDIIYNNAIGNKITVIGKDNWALDITNPPKPFAAYLKATSTSPFGSVTTGCTVNILVNGSLMKTVTISGNPEAVAETEYRVE